MFSPQLDGRVWGLKGEAGFRIVCVSSLVQTLGCEGLADVDALEKSRDGRTGLQGKENLVFNSFKLLRSASNRSQNNLAKLAIIRKWPKPGSKLPANRTKSPFCNPQLCRVSSEGPAPTEAASGSGFGWKVFRYTNNCPGMWFVPEKSKLCLNVWNSWCR